MYIKTLHSLLILYNSFFEALDVQENLWKEITIFSSLMLGICYHYKNFLQCCIGVHFMSCCIVAMFAC